MQNSAWKLWVVVFKMQEEEEEEARDKKKGNLYNNNTSRPWSCKASIFLDLSSMLWWNSYMGENLLSENHKIGCLKSALIQSSGMQHFLFNQNCTWKFSRKVIWKAEFFITRDCFLGTFLLLWICLLDAFYGLNDACLIFQGFVDWDLFFPLEHKNQWFWEFLCF